MAEVQRKDTTIKLTIRLTSEEAVLFHRVFGCNQTLANSVSIILNEEEYNAIAKFFTQLYTATK